MRYFKKLTPLIAISILLFVLSACGTSLEKPTGLENSDDKSIEITLEDEKEHDTNKKASSSKVDNKTSEADKSKSDKKDNEKQKTEETNEKETDVNKDVTNKTSSEKADTKGKSESKKKSTNKKSNETKKEASKSSKGNKSSTTKTTSVKSEKKAPPKKQTTTTSPPKKEEKPKETKPTVVQSIVISSSEVPLSATETEIKDGDKPLNALITITKNNGIQMDYTGSGGSAYVQGIANVYEFDRGQGSGWMYRINGVFPDRGVGVVPLKDGDRLEWLYTKDLGKDIGADLKPFRR